MTHTDDLMSIGSFAEATLLSHKALRLYDQRGLLAPAVVDPHSGYRYYRPDQRARARLIGLLRGAGMSLNDIAILLSVDAATALARIESQRATLQQTARTASLLLDRARNHYTEDTMNSAYELTTGEQTVLSELTRPSIESIDETFAPSVERLRALAADRGLTVTGDPFAIFHGRVDEESQGPVELCLPVDRLTDDTEGVRNYRVAGGRFAAINVQGEETDFPAVLAAYDSVAMWIERQGYAVAGPPREIWHVLPWADETTAMTICFPFVAI